MVQPSGEYDRLVVGAGIFGLYAAGALLRKGMSVAVVDLDAGQVMRASLVNQARVHNGYHYPRSAYTALRSAQYYERFVLDFPSAINRHFTKIYAISANGSQSDARHFTSFCNEVGIPARAVDPLRWFRPTTVEAAFETDEYSFDAPTLRRDLMRRLSAAGGECAWYLRDTIVRAEPSGEAWDVQLRSGTRLRASGVVNATYAGTNGVLDAFGLPALPLKYELCEVAMVAAPAQHDVGITVMDGPFFSLMPFGHSGRHSLTAVDYTPRLSSRDPLPEFACQDLNAACSPRALDNCGLCPVRPVSAFPQMAALARRYLNDTQELALVEALHSVKAVLATSEIDDSRPTLIKVHQTAPLFLSLFSGKINTLYDLDEVL